MNSPGTPWRLHAWLLLLLACFWLTGCAPSTVTKENYDKIKNGMTLAEVEKILGKGDEQMGDGSNVAGQFGIAVDGGGGPKRGEMYVWESGNKKITIHFKQGKVVSKTSAGL